MKKLFITLIFTITTSCLFGMKPKLEPIIKFFPEDNPEKNTYPYDAKKMILLELAQNVLYHTRSKYISKRAQLASQIIGYVSFVNKDLYKELDKQRNDPIAIRPIMIDIAYDTRFNNYNYFYVENMPLPGAQKCIEYTKQLTDEKLTPDKAEQLFQQGAILNYQHNNCQSPLSYWCSIWRDNSPESIAVFKKLLEFGADHNECCVLSLIMNTNRNIDIAKDLISTILKYPTKKDERVWQSAIKEQEYVDLLIPGSTKEELNIGLRACVDQCSGYKPEIMQQLIKNGANPDIVLGLEMNILFDWNQGTYGNNSSLNKLTFLCAQGGFDQKVLNTLKDKREILDCLIQQLEKNQTLRDIKIDEK